MYSKHLIKATVLGIISIIILNLILSQKYISVTRYEYKNPRITEDFRVVHLTDLHNYQFGEYYGAVEPPVRCGESHLSGLTEPPHFVY